MFRVPPKPYRILMFFLVILSEDFAFLPRCLVLGGYNSSNTAFALANLVWIRKRSDWTVPSIYIYTYTIVDYSSFL